MIKGQRKSWIVLGIAIALIAAGWYRGEVHTVATKAAAICMECIGIG